MVTKLKPAVARFVPSALATAIVIMMIVAHPNIHPVARGIAIGGAVAAWVFALLFERREVRMHASVVAGIVGVVSAGQVANGGVAYGIACGVFLLGCLSAMRAIQSGKTAGKAPEKTIPRTPAKVFGLLFGTAGVITTLFLIGLPWLAVRVERKVTSMFGADDGDEATAFSTRMVLGSTRGMFQSDRIVMRIEGERPDYLRGAVYDRYQGRFWSTSLDARRREPIPTQTNFSTSTTKMLLARGTPTGDDMRWFLPANACDLALPQGSIEIDRFGVARRPRKAEEPFVIGMRTSGCTKKPATFAEPSPEDIHVPDSVAATLIPIANQWTANATTDHEKLNALVRELAKFEYSLAVERDNRVDAIVDFMTTHRAGHCEMFASAMVLLARTQHIPARVVGGYRVTEVNPLTNLAIVRDRNAHTWVEAYVDGAWRGFDPTPTSEGIANEGHTLDYIGDVLSIWWDRALTYIVKLGTLGTAIALGGLVIALLLLRAFLRWLNEARLRRRNRNRSASDQPLPCFVDLTSALAARGHPHDPSEPIESFARAIDELEDRPWSKPVAAALRRYAEYRYGNVGSEDEVVTTMTRATKALS